ncbi:hypothetical protein CF95_gp122 [Erwinia phage PhiEaH1]|uniref:Uncharacterized protein n=1 Tax=Erwinia phage PhiEaH1 TaxID=1401669 RepID=W8D069_9CAUD|nr:hypothetical protein CF95_gp122 [Erwinia phage PhiEaH1]AGX01844.1 hypothetical protein [Erwinia phage PhiEaH1]
MNNNEDFMNLPLVNVVAKTEGARVLESIDVPGRKMMAVVVGVPDGLHVVYHCFGVRKSDGVITTRFDTPKRIIATRTSFAPAEGLSEDRIKHLERVTLKNAALARLSRNFYRRVVKTPELLEGGLEYYGTLTETQFVWALCEQVAILNKSKLPSRKPGFPEWRGTFRFELDDKQHQAVRRLTYNADTKLVAAHYTFFGGVAANHNAVVGSIDPAKLPLGKVAASINIAASYANGQWDKTEVFVLKNEGFLREFFLAFTPASIEG